MIQPQIMQTLSQPRPLRHIFRLNDRHEKRPVETAHEARVCCVLLLRYLDDV